MQSTSISSTNITIPDIRKRPRSEEGSNPKGKTSRIRTATKFFTPPATKKESTANKKEPLANEEERCLNADIVHELPVLDLRNKKQQKKNI